MKKQLLSAFFTLLCVLGFSQAATARNAYAYGLSSKFNADKTALTVNYSLNTVAEEANVVMYLDKNYAATFSGTTNAGENKIEIPASALPQGGTITWAVSVKSATVEKPTLDEKTFKFYAPHGIIVDANPESKHFGRIITTEAIAPSKSGYLSSTDGIGIYAFDPQLNSIKTKDGGLAFKGGIDLKKGKEGSTSYLDPKKIRLTDDGRIFIGRLTFDGTQSSIYEVNPDDLDANFTEFFKGTVTETSEINNADGKFIGGQVVSFDFKGSGKDLKMLVLSSNKSGAAFAFGGFRTDEYNIGTATSWDKEPSASIENLTKQYTISATNATVAYDNKGGIWYCQYRATPTEGEPALIHLNAKGEEDYKDITTVCGGAGFKFNKDFSLVAIANKKANVGIYSITEDASGKPVLNLQYEFATTIGTNCNDMAWDYANNLYIVGNSGEWLKVFALPNGDGYVTTPAMAEYTFDSALTAPEELYVLHNDKTGNFDPADKTGKMTKTADGVFEIKDVEIYPSEGNYGFFTFTATPGDWSTVNANRYTPSTFDELVALETATKFTKKNEGSFKIEAGTYTFTVDFNKGTILVKGTVAPPQPETYPAKLYALGNTDSPYGHWQTDDATYPLEAVAGSEGVYKGDVTLKSSYGSCYFVFTSQLGTSSTDWATVNANRYGPAKGNVSVTLNTPVDIVKTTDGNASYALTTEVDVATTVSVTIDLKNGKMTLTNSVGTEDVATDVAKVVAGTGEISIIGEANDVEVYTIGGALVSKGETHINCAAGYYIVVIDKKATKVVVK